MLNLHDEYNYVKIEIVDRGADVVTYGKDTLLNIMDDFIDFVTDFPMEEAGVTPYETDKCVLRKYVSSTYNNLIDDNIGWRFILTVNNKSFEFYEWEILFPEIVRRLRTI